MAWKWFGVRTLYRWEAKGRPVRRPAHYDPKMTLVEDRVVLVKARGHREAIRKGEQEAKRYVNGAVVNPFGQKVRIRYLGVCDAGEIYEDLATGAELFSDTYAVSRDCSDESVIDRFRGPSMTTEEQRKRDKFSDAELVAELHRRLTTS